MSDGYRQCCIRKGSQVDVAWIPARFATKGRSIRLRQSPDIWTVVEVYGAMQADDLRVGRRSYIKELPSIIA